MLTTRERAAQTAAPPPVALLQSDARYRSLARQMHLRIELNYKFGYSYPSVEWLAAKLRITERMVQYNDEQLRAAGLIDTELNTGPRGVNKVYAVPCGGIRDKAAYRVQTAAAWACSDLDLNYRVVWWFAQTSYQGNIVKTSLIALKAILHAQSRNIRAAIKINEQRGRLLALTHGRRVNDYRVLAKVYRTEGGSDQMTIDEQGNTIDAPSFAQPSLTEFYRSQLRRRRRDG
jgi:hypothetical protein